ncbi:MAG: outer membrane protein assembly factor BamB [Gammaproteobacteria bacterium]|nr:outer membrane protein assembly factor BamB [Gammaproteobacteria bacterium]
MRKILVITMTLLLAACGGGKKSAAEDDQSRPAALPEIQPEVTLKKLWSRSVSSDTKELHVTLVPALVDGIVYMADHTGRITATDGVTGKSVWQQRLKVEITAGIGHGEGLIYIGTGQGALIAINMEDGKVQWETGILGEVLAPPMADESIVVARTIDGRVYGLSTSDGEQRWSYQREVPSLTLRGDSAVLVDQGVAIAGFANGKVVVSDLEAGTLLWEITAAHPRGRDEIERLIDIDAQPLLVGSVLYVGVYQSQVMALALGTRRILWTRDLSTFRDIGADNDRVYVSDDQDHIMALSRLTGDVSWSQEGLHQRGLTPPTVVGDYVVVGDFEGYVHLLDKGDGRLVGRIKVGGDGVSAKCLAQGDTLYVITRKGVLSALKLTGSL